MIRYPPWDPKARLHLHIGCPYCWDDDPDVACDCPCHEEDREDERRDGGRGQSLAWEIFASREPVPVFLADYLTARVQGPSPLWCELEEHPSGTWHREGRTWWK